MNSEEKLVLFAGKREKSARTDGRGRGRPTRQQISQRNEELLETALNLFLERGFEGATIDAITDRLGMSRRTVYNRYGDKTGLFKAALQKAVDEWTIPSEKLRAAETNDLTETLFIVAQMLIANMVTPSGRRLIRIANHEAFRMPEIAEYLWERTAHVTVEYVRGLLIRKLWNENGYEKIAGDSALAFLVLVIGGSSQETTWRIKSKDELDRQIRFRLDLFLDGIHKVSEKYKNT